MLQLLSRLLRFALLAAASALAGCVAERAEPGTPAEPAPSADPPRVVLGTGQTAFIELPEEGGEAEIISGIQGGFHVDLTARLYRLDPEGLTLAYEVRDAGSGALLSFPAAYALNARRVSNEGDHLLRVGDRAVLEIASPDELAGRAVELSCAALRDGAELALDLRRVTLVDADDELP